MLIAPFVLVWPHLGWVAWAGPSLSSSYHRPPARPTNRPINRRSRRHCFHRYLYGHGVPASCDKAALYYEVAANAAVDEMERLKVRESARIGI